MFSFFYLLSSYLLFTIFFLKNFLKKFFMNKWSIVKDIPKMSSTKTVKYISNRSCILPKHILIQQIGENGYLLHTISYERWYWKNLQGGAQSSRLWLHEILLIYALHRRNFPSGKQFSLTMIRRLHFFL